MRVVILGASGQIGKYVHRELKKIPKAEIAGTSRKPEKGYLRFDPFSDDWSLLGNRDVLINCIGQIEETKGFTFEKVHMQLTSLIVQNRVLIGNPRIIQLSVLGADEKSVIDFLYTKGMADKYLIQFSNTVVVRPSIVCTPGTMLVKKMKLLLNISRFSAGRALVPEGFLGHKIQPVMAEDLAVIVSNLCEADFPPQVLNVTGPEPISYRKLLEWMFLVNGKPARFIELPRLLTDSMVNVFIASFFPGIINKQQYHLLFQDNTANKSEAEKYRGTPLTSTVDFWKNEFK